MNFSVVKLFVPLPGMVTKALLSTTTLRKMRTHYNTGIDGKASSSGYPLKQNTELEKFHICSKNKPNCAPDTIFHKVNMLIENGIITRKNKDFISM